MGGCQNYGPFLSTLNIRCRIIIGTQKRDHNFDNHPYARKLRMLYSLLCQELVNIEPKEAAKEAEAAEDGEWLFRV